MDSEEALREADHGTGSGPQGRKQGGRKEDQEAAAEAELKELLSSLTLSEAEVVGLAAVLHEKNPSAVDAWYRSVTRSDPAQQEEASVQQLSQELQVEQHKTSRAVRRGQCAALDLDPAPAPAPGTIQDLQAQLDMKDQEIQKLQAELEAVSKELHESPPPYEKESMSANYAEFHAVFLRLEKQMLKHIERGRRALESQTKVDGSAPDLQQSCFLPSSSS